MEAFDSLSINHLENHIKYYTNIIWQNLPEITAIMQNAWGVFTCTVIFKADALKKNTKNSKQLHVVCNIVSHRSICRHMS